MDAGTARKHASAGRLDDLNTKMSKLREAQKIFAGFSQEQVDKIFQAAALAAGKQSIPLAEMAVRETGKGIVQDKALKNNYACEHIYRSYKDTKTCGLVETDPASGIRKIAEPVGIIAAVMPVTNPTSTAIFKALLTLKTRNGIIFIPHPGARRCIAEAAHIVLKAAVQAGAPEGIISCLPFPALEISQQAMRSADLILATSSASMVKAAYSSGKPAIGVGAGNVPAVFHKSADITLAVDSVIVSKTFDNGMVCSSEQAIIVDDSIYNTVKNKFISRGCYFLKPEETERMRKTMFTGGVLNSKIVGQSASAIAALAGINVPADTKILIGEVESVDDSEEFSREKLSPVLAMYRYTTFDEAISKADKLVITGGYGHTSSIFIDTSCNTDLAKFEAAIKTCRILINTPSSQGALGGWYNFLPPSLTLSCGSWGGNSISENLGVKHLLNIKTVAERRENMLQPAGNTTPHSPLPTP